MFARATAYYLGCVTRNRVVAGFRRLKRPKYLIGLTLVVLYFWLILFANPGLASDSDPEVQRRNGRWMLSGMCLLHVVVAWFATGRGLAFREAEVQILFPRPFSRFQLLLFKWVGGQIAALVSSLIIALFFSRYDGFSYPNVAAGFWLLQSVLATHATVSGLLQSHAKSRGGLAERLRLVPAWTLLAAVPLCVGLAWQRVGGGVRDLDGIAELVATRPLSSLLAPFELLAAPLVTTELASFASAAVAPLVLLALHLAFMWRADLRFEDQAIELASKIERVRSEGFGAFRSKKDLVVAKPGSTWQLAPTGASWKALVWKNTISITRVPRRTMIRIAVMVVLVAVVLGGMAGQSEGGHGPTRFGFVVLGLLGYLTLLAPALVRVDLRIDIPHFDVLKSMPLRGRDLVFGEVMGPVLVLWVLQAVGAVVAAILISHEGDIVLPWSDKVPLLAGLLVGFLALDFALLTAENLLALWLPGFVRLGRGLKPGLDQMGLNLLGALVRMLVLGILFAVPGVVGAFLGSVAAGLGVGYAVATLLGLAVGSAILAGESWLMIALSEGRYDRFDITSESTRADG